MTAEKRAAKERPRAPIDSKYLVSKIKEERYTYTNIAKQMGISTTALRNKLQGKVDFNVNEVVELRDILNLSRSDTYNIFFAPSVEKKSRNSNKK